MRRNRLHDSKACESQEAVLTWRPVKLGGNGDASEAILFDGDAGLLRKTVFEDCAKPGKYEAGDVDSGSGDKVVPTGERVVAVPEEGNHEDDDAREVSDLEELVTETPNT
tara:strand:+ start:115 stop:444 length:330 start_codon:yes stop_codon:yes gene_type:complete